MKKQASCLLLIMMTIPSIAHGAAYAQKMNTTLSNLDAFIIEILLWFIFITVSSFATYFIVNTFILISNNRQYRHLLHKDESTKTEQEKSAQHRALTAIKAAETRLGMLGAIIAFFVIAYVLLSSYIYLGPTVREQMWQIIYYGVGGLTILIIIYAGAFLWQKMKYHQLPSDDLERERIVVSVGKIRKRLKMLLMIIIGLILTYLVLLITIIKGVNQLSRI
jgi:hypothetical protein